jgi:RNA polymerase sigma-70 factor, ECF subfamily
LPRLFKFALVLSANEELARALLRSTCRSLVTRRNWQEDDRDCLIDAFRHMYALWATKSSDDPNIQLRCPPDARLFTGSAVRGPLAGNAHFAKFITSLTSSQRAVLYLVYGDGSSYDEAAEITGLPIQTLMKLLARGHLALSHWLDHRGLGEGGAFGNAESAGLEPKRAADHWRERAA